MIFGIWCILAFGSVMRQIQKTVTFLLPVYSLSLEERHKLIDGDFYDFVKQCATEVGPEETVVFKAVPREPDFRTPDWFLKEYFVGRLSYFLYPRKILRGQGVIYKPGYIIIFDTDSKDLRLNYL
ncbi:MAG: hypothetical protein PHV92_03255 [Candidatus Omnitrophica bacterium]|nr:hypothetical protein [Candidatus Omnitrophota bacterium]MDD5518227.1 hypothetical protein [Candidatus Omnitrophota bacterium]